MSRENDKIIKKDLRYECLFAVFLLLLVTDVVCFLWSEKRNRSNESSTQVYLEWSSTSGLGLATAGQQRSSFTTEVELPAELSPFFFNPVPLNEASKELLMTIRGLGPSLADKIIDYRTIIGPILNVDDLQSVKGIGPRKAALFEQFLDFGVQ